MVLRVDVGDLDSDVNGLHFLHGTPFSGEAVETSTAGVLRSLTTYIDGVERGPHRLWHPNGRPEFSCEVENGNPVGLARSWRADGSLEEEQQFDEDGALRWQRRWTVAGEPLDTPDSRSA